MAAGLALSVAQTLFSVLQCHTELRELCSMFGYESKLEDLKDTVFLIKAVLLDADSKHQELTETGRNWVEKLKDAVYDADDLFDELTSKAQQLKNTPGGNLSKKVRRFFSNENQLLFGFNKSREIKKLRKKLNAITDDRVKFGVSDQYKPVKRREETCSYVYETSIIIGREQEREKVVGLLLSASTTCVNTQKNVSFVSIVGMGGLGKTALSQLIFNDKRIKDAFGEDMYWVCVSEEFGLKEILSKFPKMNSEHTLQELQEEVLKKIKGKKYLLVLDDVWEESRYKWLELKRILGSGGSGSQILVTTRSKEVTKVIDKGVVVHELEYLSDENSWQLFKDIAFGPMYDHDPHKVAIGKDIVKKCANVPLSIKVTSSLLYGLDKTKWEDYRSRDLADMSCHGKENIIMPTLMFSYYNLTPALKSCFSFCSIFPKDYEIKKELLISLWLAQGYLGHEGENMDDVGADYFWILLQRCFFQDVKRDRYGEIRSCKMHDLMHDLSVKVAGKESMTVTTCSTNDLKKKLRHLSATHNAPIEALSSNSLNQTLHTLFILDGYSSMNVTTLNLNCRHLRVLHLRDCDMNLIPDELGKFLHLRYLNVSNSYSLEKLPRSITKLHNLQVLKLCKCKALTELPKELGKLVNLRMLDIHGCSELKELSEDVGKLVNLRILDIRECSQLKELPECIVELVNLRIFKITKKSDYKNECKIRYMPAGMNKLTNLHTLTYFAVGGDSPTHVHKGELIDLKSLSYLRGHLHIKVGRFPPNIKPMATIGVDILRKAHLQSLEISCEYGIDEIYDLVEQGECYETSIEGLNPNNDHLTELKLSGYQGVEFPKWGVGKLSFPVGIVRMELTSCVRLKHLSSVSKLVCLKYLELWDMKNLEYIERDAPCDVRDTFFVSLEELTVFRAHKLKGWWRDVTCEGDAEGGSGCLVDANGSCLKILPSFVRLHHLKISYCNSLKYFPSYPHLKKLDLCWVNKALSFCMKRSTYYHPSQVKGSNSSTSSSSLLSIDSSSTHLTFFFLEEFEILYNNREVFNSLFWESFLGCVAINIRFLSSEKEVIKMREGFQRCASFVRHLRIRQCDFHRMPDGGFEYLTNLHSLEIKRCHNLESLGKDGMHHLPTIQSLRIESCYNLEDLGESICSLTSLQSLYIENCPKLKSLPKAFGQLTSLSQLHIYEASNELKERCREDWPNIHHIPNLEITEATRREVQTSQLSDDDHEFVFDDE